MTITIKMSFKFGNRTRNLSANKFDESTTFGFESYWYEHGKQKISHLESTPVGKKTPDPRPLIQ